MNKKSIYSLLSLAMKAGKIASGEFCVEKSVKSGHSYFVIVAEDASDNTKKMFRDMCLFYEVPIYEFGSKEELAHAIGKEMRASLAVTDEGIAKSIIQKLETGM